VVELSKEPKKKLFSYFVCPFCGHVIFEGYAREKFSTFENVEPLDWEVLQRRQQVPRQPRWSGKKGGFHLVEHQRLTIGQMAESATYKEFALKIANRVKRIYEAYKKAGLIPEE